MAEEMKGIYDYQKATVREELLSQYIDGYACFGWREDENIPRETNMGKVTLALKRDRSILNKPELTRLQQHYEACMNEIIALEESKKGRAMALSLGCGLAGCAFVAGSVFAVTAQPPIVWLCVLLAVPGFALWLAAWLGYKIMELKRAARVAPLIEKKRDEACEVCDRARKLL